MQQTNQPLFPPPPPPPPLPSGWEQALDPASGRHYYANRSTGETSWVPPPRPYFPPPPPSHPVSYQGGCQHSIPKIAEHASKNQIIYSSPPPSSILAASFPVAAGRYSQKALPPIPSQLNQPVNIQVPSDHLGSLGSFPSSSAKVGYHLGASTASSPGLLVSSVRAMIDVEYTNKCAGDPLPKLELEGLSTGVIADLCNVTTEFRARSVQIDKGDFANEDGRELLDAVSSGQEADKQQVDECAKIDGFNQYYIPLQPFELPVASRPPNIEAGRVDIRLHSLYYKLNRI